MFYASTSELAAAATDARCKNDKSFEIRKLKKC